MSNPNKLPETSEWTFELLDKINTECARIAKDMGIDTYPNQIEVITSEQMMDAYSSVGMPVSYPHWSFGKSFIQTERDYKKGNSGLAYEIVINSSPCIAYLMEENSLMMQTLVIAHASYGHNSFFKNNYLFKEWTDAEGILDYLLFAKGYIAECEAKYGSDKVEKVLDACHSLQAYGVDRYKRPSKLSVAGEKKRQEERAEYAQTQVNELWGTLPEAPKGNEKRFPAEPQENILYFIEKHAPHLETWKREIIRITRKLSTYFYPQKQTQLCNEGWATFTHYNILNTMYEEGLVGEGFMLEFLESHAGVVAQNGQGEINPYALGFAMFQDIRRICENPTEEDVKWFPDMAGKDWKTETDFAMRNFRDESFISQYLSPKIIRDFHLFSVIDDDEKPRFKVSAIHDDAGYKHIRSKLSEQYNLSNREPDIQVWDANLRGKRNIVLRYQQDARVPLNTYTEEVLKHVAHLWGYAARLDTVDAEGNLLDFISVPGKTS